MAKLILTDARIFVGGADLSGNTSRAEVSYEIESKEATNFRSGGAVELLAGLRSATIEAEGQWEAGSTAMVDNAMWASVTTASGPWTVCPSDAITGAVAYFTKMFHGDYSFLGDVGEVAPWTASASSTWPLVRGTVMNPPATARTVSGTGTAVQLGAVAANQHVYAALHVISATGTTPSATFRLESDDNSGFTSATIRGTFAAATTAGGEIIRVAGPITDNWWRASWTITGTSPSFLAILVAGIA